MNICERVPGDLKELKRLVRAEKHADRRDRLRAVVLAILRDEIRHGGPGSMKGVFQGVITPTQPFSLMFLSFRRGLPSPRLRARRGKVAVGGG